MLMEFFGSVPGSRFAAVVWSTNLLVFPQGISLQPANS
jgi:hypothetical protein